VSDKEKFTGLKMPKANQTLKMADGYNDRPRALTTEERLRKENPGLQELWDQYQTMLKLLTPAETKSQRSLRNSIFGDSAE